MHIKGDRLQLEAMQIFDPIHNFILFNPLEASLISHPYMERLRHIYQMGPAFHVYPGGTHSRFTHSIGVMHVASEIYDNIVLQNEIEEDVEFLRQVVRIGALLHDIGHYPLSHTAELFLPKHEKMVEKVFNSAVFEPFFAQIAKIYGKTTDHTTQLIRAIALGEPTTPPFLSQMIANPHFGADRIDYLLRDSLFTGLSYGKIDVHQLIRSLRLSDAGVLVVSSAGIPSVEALLLARHWMHERLYQHPRVRAYAYHYACVIKQIILEQNALDDLDVFMKINDHTIFEALGRFKEHEEAILDVSKRVIAQKALVADLKKYQELTGVQKPLYIDLSPFSQQTFEGTRIRIETEETFWVYLKPTTSFTN